MGKAKTNEGNIGTCEAPLTFSKMTSEQRRSLEADRAYRNGIGPHIGSCNSTPLARGDVYDYLFMKAPSTFNYDCGCD